MNILHAVLGFIFLILIGWADIISIRERGIKGCFSALRFKDLYENVRGADWKGELLFALGTHFIVLLFALILPISLVIFPILDWVEFTNLNSTHYWVLVVGGAISAKISWIMAKNSKETSQERGTIKTGVASNKSCKHCGKNVITTSEYLDKVECAGVAVDRSTGNVNAMDLARTGTDRVVYDTGYSCNSCGTVYCHKCLLDYAPENYSGSGKSCPKCGGRFSKIG